MLPPETRKTAGADTPTVFSETFDGNQKDFQS